MAQVKYEIVQHDGGWAYRLGGTYSETFPTHGDALAAAKIAAVEQQVKRFTAGSSAASLQTNAWTTQEWQHFLGSLPAVLETHKATRTIPILMVMARADPTVVGLAASMARPGGNVTGFWLEGDEALVGKRLDLLKLAVPGISRVGVMVNPDDAGDANSIKALPAAARALGLAVRVLDVRSAAEVEPSFAAAVHEGLQGLHVSQSSLFNANRAQVTAMAARAGLPAVYGFREFAVAGGLISYAASLPDSYRRLAGLVDKILKGASPGDLPIERPTTFELVVNLKTAKAMGLIIPEPFLLLADEVIE